MPGVVRSSNPALNELVGKNKKIRANPTTMNLERFFLICVFNRFFTSLVMLFLIFNTRKEPLEWGSYKRETSTSFCQAFAR
jgi:hypothetical protein